MAAARTAMTDRQRRFVQEYLVDHRGGPAAVRAGYARAGCRVTAHKLLTEHSAVKAAIAAAQAQDAQRLQIERLDVIKGLLEAYEMAKKQGNPAAMISAMATLSRLMGFNAPERRQAEVTSLTAVDERSRLEAMSDTELMSIAAGAA